VASLFLMGYTPQRCWQTHRFELSGTHVAVSQVLLQLPINVIQNLQHLHHGWGQTCNEVLDSMNPCRNP
jgi:hypothetical protein